MTNPLSYLIQHHGSFPERFQCQVSPTSSHSVAGTGRYNTRYRTGYRRSRSQTSGGARLSPVVIQLDPDTTDHHSSLVSSPPQSPVDLARPTTRPFAPTTASDNVPLISLHHRKRTKVKFTQPVPFVLRVHSFFFVSSASQSYYSTLESILFTPIRKS